MSVSGPRSSDIVDPWASSTSSTGSASASASTAGSLRSTTLAGNNELAAIAGGTGELARGARGDATRLVQTALVELGLLSATPGADGIFGRQTEAAIAAFQRSAGLAASGKLDARTLAALDQRLAGPATPPTTPPVVRPTPGAVDLKNPAFAGNATLAAIAAGNGALERGARGEPTRVLQDALIGLGLLSATPGADGIFGRQTASAIARFQMANGLQGNGRVDAETLKKLDAATAGGTGGTAPVETPPTPGMRVDEGNSRYSLDDDTLYMTGEGSWSSTIGRDIYVAGYLPRTEGPLNDDLGTAATPSNVLSAADNRLNADKSPVERFDEAMKRATGTAGGMTARYAVDGKQPEAESWWGYCDRWAYAALDPEVATKVNEPIMLNGVYFSTAELRGIASYLGRSDEGRSLFDKDVTALDLQKAATMFLKQNGPGFISDVWLDSAHDDDYQVWNQPFDAVDQDAKELKGADLEKVLKDQFGLSGADLAGKRAFYVETTGHYGIEEGDEYEGAASHEERTWKSWILTDADGKALDGKYAPGSADALEYIWQPDRTGAHTGEAKFFRQLLNSGVSANKVKEFETALSRLPASPSDAQKAEIKRQFKGVAAAFPEADLAAKLRSRGLTPADFR